MAGASSLFASFQQYLTIDDAPHFVVSLSGKYVCAYCHNGLRIPVKQTACGHRMCDQCLHILLGNGQQRMCPQGEEDCLMITLQTVYPDRATDREILHMNVYCKHHPKCTDIIRYKSLENHLLTKCEFHFIPCLNAEKGCRATYKRKDGQHHLDQDCKFEFLSCNYCASQFARMDIKEHEKRCLEEETTCLYADEGCDFRSKRKSMLNHFQEAQGHHLKLCTNVLRRLKVDKTALESELESIQQKIYRLENKTAMSSQDIAELKASTFEKQNKIQNTLTVYMEKVSALGSVTKKAEKAKSDIETLSQHVDVLEERQYWVKDSSQPTKNSSSNTEHERTARTVAAHDVALAEYEIRFRCLETANYDGMLLWKICNYWQRKQMAQEGRTLSLYSQPFYTHPYGYKMCGRLYLSGDGIGKGSHASLYFVIMKGDYDSILPWPFRQKITLTLMDQETHRAHITDTFRPDPTSSSFQQPVSDLNVASGSPKFVQQGVIDNPPYLKNDTVFIMIKVDTTDLNPLP